MSRLRAGDWIEVRSKEEILRTLDKQGRLGRHALHAANVSVLRASASRFTSERTRPAIRSPSIGILPVEALPDGIHLNLRCDGQAYGGCQAACLIFWKEQWLKPVNGPAGHAESPTLAGAARA